MEKIFKNNALSVIHALKEGFTSGKDIKTLSLELDVPYTTLFETLKELEEYSLVTREKVGKKHEYELNLDSNTTKRFLALLNDLNAANSSPDLPEKALEKRVIYCSLNEKPLLITEKRESFEGLESITLDDLKRNLEQNPEISNEILVFEGFEEYYEALKSVSSASKGKVKTSKSEETRKLKELAKIEVSQVQDFLKASEFNKAIQSLYKALEHTSNEFALRDNKKTGKQNLQSLTLKKPELVREVNSVKLTYKKSKKSECDLTDVKRELSNVVKIINSLNA